MPFVFPIYWSKCVNLVEVVYSKYKEREYCIYWCVNEYRDVEVDENDEYDHPEDWNETPPNEMDGTKDDTNQEDNK
jgi:hypothetical protein